MLSLRSELILTFAFWKELGNIFWKILYKYFKGKKVWPGPMKLRINIPLQYFLNKRSDLYKILNHKMIINFENIFRSMPKRVHTRTYVSHTNVTRNLPLNFCQNQLNNSWDIANIEFVHLVYAQSFVSNLNFDNS